MEGIILDGKKYISSKQAAEISGYSHDYIGQLVRAGTLSGRLIGRTRFVEEESFLKYFEHTDHHHNTLPEVQNNITPKTYPREETSPDEFSGYSHGWQSRSRFDTAVEINIKTKNPNENILSQKISQVKNLSSNWQGKLPYTTTFVSVLLVISGVFILFSSSEPANKVAYVSGTINALQIEQANSQTAALAEAGITDDINFNIKKAIDGLALRIYKNVSGGGNKLISFVNGLFTRSAMSGGGTGRNFFSLFNRDKNTNIAPETVTSDSSASKSAPVKITQSNQIETKEQPTKVSATESPRIIERIIERVIEKVPATVITAEVPNTSEQAVQVSAEVDSKLEQLKNKVFSEIYKVADGLSSKTNTVYQAVSLTNKIDNLNKVTISDATITGSTYAGSVSGTSGSFSGSLSANGGFSATAGTFSGNLTVSGAPTFYGALTLPYFTSTSTTATSTIAGQFVNTFVPSIAHTFGAWSPGVSGSNPLTASVMINPASATADSNLFSISIADSAKFLIDAEGDVFANSLTASGGVTLSTTTASTFSVENNATFGDSTTTDRTYFNSRIGSSLIPNTNNLLDIGDTTNWLSWRTGLFGTSVGVGGTATSTGSQLTASGAYLIDSGGALSLNTTNNQNIVTGVGNFGIGTSSPYAKLSVVGPIVAEYFHATSTVATSTFAGGLNVGTGALTYDFSSLNVGVGTLSPARKFSIFNTSSNPQFRISYDTTNYAEFTIDAAGDLKFAATGGDIRALDENLYICAGGACPTGSPTGNGNLIIESSLGVGSSTPFAKLSIGADGAIVTTEKTLTDGATVSVSWTDGNQQRVTLGGNRTVTFSNYIAGQILRLVVCQDGTGSRTVTWPSAVLWNGGSAPTLTTDANKCDALSFVATIATSTLKIFGASVLSF